MLRNVGSLCPLLLIYNDADTALPMSQLEQAYGANQMLPLSLLKARYKWQPPRSRAQVPAAGRRLFSSSEAYKTHLKLWLWALPTTHRVVYLDLDILILRNIDALLDVVPPTLPDGSPGLGAVTCKTRFGERFFNSGILVLTPSLRTLEQLLELKRFASAPWNGQIPRLADIHGRTFARRAMIRSRPSGSFRTSTRRTRSLHASNTTGLGTRRARCPRRARVNTPTRAYLTLSSTRMRACRAVSTCKLQATSWTRTAARSSTLWASPSLGAIMP